MASLTWQVDTTSPAGSLIVHADHPGILAGVADAALQFLQHAGDVATLWALHPSEQDGSSRSAFLHERAELGPAAEVQVVELARPRQRNVVWIDRYHLVARTPALSAISRVAGLYVGTEGEMIAYVHHPSVSHVFTEAALAIPHSGTRNWDDATLIAQCRFSVRYMPKSGDSMRLSYAPPFRQQIDQALHHLRSVAMSV